MTRSWRRARGGNAGARASRLLVLAALAVVLSGCSELRAVRGCGEIPFDPAVVAPVASPAAAVAPDERERRAREIVARRTGRAIEEVVVRESAVQDDPRTIPVYGYKLYTPDGRFLGTVLLDAGGQEVSENALGIARVVADVRARGKIDDRLSDAVARSLPWDAVPVVFDVVAPPWPGPPSPWPQNATGDEWNAFVDRYADEFYRPRVTPLIEHLRSIGALDIDPDLAAGLVRAPSVFARVPAGQVCSAVRRADVLRAAYNPPIVLN